MGRRNSRNYQELSEEGINIKAERRKRNIYGKNGELELMNNYECTEKFEKVVRALNALTDRELMRYDTAPESATEEELKSIWGEYRAEKHIYITASMMLNKIIEAEAEGNQKNYKYELANLLNFTAKKQQQAKGGYKEGYAKALHMLSGAYLIEIRK